MAALATVCTLLVAEVLVRFAAPQQLILLRPDIWQPEDRVGWQMRPGLDTRVNTGEREVGLRTDEHGHRIGDTPSVGADVSILALGDSLLAALQVDYELTLTAILQTQLTDLLGREVEVVNAGVGGWGPSHYLIDLDTELERKSYDLVVVFLFAGNDIETDWLRTFPPKESTVRHRLRIPQSLSLSELEIALVYPVNDFLETRSHLFILVRNRMWFALMRLGLSARKFPEVLTRNAAAESRWSVTAEICKNIEQEVTHKGARVLFVLLPGAYQVDRQLGRQYATASGVDWNDVDLEQPSRLLTEEFERRNLVLLDALSPLRSAAAVGRQRLFGRVDTHLGPEGHRTVAEYLLPELVEALTESEETDEAQIPGV